MFSLDKDQSEKLAKWREEQYAKSSKDELGHVRVGAIGGAFTYSFTPTTLGCVVKVYNATTKEEIDLTDYDMW